MRGLWLQDGRRRLRDDLPNPSLQPGEALVRVAVAGICGTDLELARGYYPFAGVPGHEFVGRVEMAPGAESWVGRRVVGEINVACGACTQCAAGRRTHCAQRTVIGIRGRGGALAELLAVPIANLHQVPPSVPDEVAVFTEPTAAALEIQEQVAIGPGRRVAVIGPGRLGQLVARTLALTGCELRVAGRSAGNPEGLEQARRAVRPRGTIVLKSTYHGQASVNLSAFVVDEITLIGSRCGPFGKALDLLASGRLDVSDLVSGVYPLAQAEGAFDAAGRPGALKVLVRPT
ncbi:MAG: alcohol dehydrogenase [Acidobacteria bacterium]|nr:MAG: alcohol dehydrogenase [Acidobacteriota bacterium]